MQIAPTPLAGLFTVETEPQGDERGFFHRLFDADSFADAGIDFLPRQSGISRNLRRGTLRGLHYQKAPAEQAKLVRCLAGAIFDVAVDIRSGSATHGQWYGLELTPENSRALFIPGGFAHGFITLVDDTDVLYELGAGERRELSAGLRWNDPAFSIRWPLEPAVINRRDAEWPDFRSES
ncbi:dTDP-4-dehydrorhamnose 3,5-epimerase [Ferrovibrio sp.]|uniref:dTDP-4-dehydrorhamnose 3,5-epimerase n=1 Tax=Ferrovibrio sp. TaxID=1917215 RepID=UPI00260E237C|nr:dTDP-4-dehydrorhamnose 3,5-epimerase [Ferrovibrio sp.]